MRATTSFRFISAVALTVGASLAAASPVSADVQIAMRDGRVSIAAKDATIGQILSEWAKVGRTTIVNIEKIPGERVTLELTDVSEAQALELLLRRLTGYVVTARNAAAPDASAFDRIIIVPASMMTAAQAPQPSPTRSAPVPMDLPAYPQHEPSIDPAAPPQAEPPASAPTAVAPVIAGAAAVEEPAAAEVQLLDQPLPYEVVGAAAGAERAPAGNGVRRQALETVDPRNFKMPPRLLRGGTAPPPATPPQPSLPTQSNVGVARPGMIVQPPSAARPTVPIKPITPAPGQPPRNQ